MTKRTPSLEILRHHPEAKPPQQLAGRYAGDVNFGYMPTMPLDKETRHFESVGDSLGGIILPEPAGLVNPFTAAEGRRALSINVFRDKTTDEPGAYLIVTDNALERDGRHRNKHFEYSGVVSLKEGDTLPVGRKSWLPLVGFAVDKLQYNPYMAQMYDRVHSEQGIFHVHNGDLLWTDTGHTNRSMLVQNPERFTPEQIAHQDFLPAGRLAMAGADVHVQSVFAEPAPLPADLHDATGHVA